MGSAVTYTYSPELQTDSGQILRIRGTRLELIANVWLGTWILGWMFVSEQGSPNVPDEMSYPVKTVLMSACDAWKRASRAPIIGRGPLIALPIWKTMNRIGALKIVPIASTRAVPFEPFDKPVRKRCIIRQTTSNTLHRYLSIDAFDSRKLTPKVARRHMTAIMKFEESLRAVMRTCSLGPTLSH